MDDLDVILGDMLPLESEDLTGAHPREQSQANDQLLAQGKNLKDLLHLFGRQYPSGWSRTGAPEVLQLAVDFREKLIEMPSITEATLPPLSFRA
jgi:hypothetical protein